VPAGESADAKASVGGDRVRGRARRIRRDRVEQTLHERGVDLGGETRGHGDDQQLAERVRHGIARDGDEFAAVERERRAVDDASREQTGGLERGLEPGAGRVVEVRSEVDKIGERVIGGALPVETRRVGLVARGERVDQRLRLVATPPLPVQAGIERRHHVAVVLDQRLRLARERGVQDSLVVDRYVVRCAAREGAPGIGRGTASGEAGDGAGRGLAEGGSPRREHLAGPGARTLAPVVPGRVERTVARGEPRRGGGGRVGGEIARRLRPLDATLGHVERTACRAQLVEVRSPLSHRRPHRHELPLDGGGLERPGRLAGLGVVRCDAERTLVQRHGAGHAPDETAALAEHAGTRERLVQLAVIAVGAAARARQRLARHAGTPFPPGDALPRLARLAGGDGNEIAQRSELSALAVDVRLLQGVDLDTQADEGRLVGADLAVERRERTLRLLQRLALPTLRTPARTQRIEAFAARLGPIPQLGRGVRAVDLQQRLDRLHRARKLGDVATVLLEIVERLRGLGQRLVGESRQRVDQVLGQLDVDPVADARRAHHVDQTDVLIERGTAEQVPLDRRSVVAAAVVPEHLVAVERGTQRVGRQGHAALDQVQVHTRPAGRDEPPGVHRIGRAVGLDAAAADEELAVALELDPQVADRLGVVATAEHPALEDAALLAGGVDSPLPGGQQERQQHVHRRRLARAVDATQQQTPAAEVQHLVLVLVDVDDAGAVQAPAGRRCRHRRAVPEAARRGAGPVDEESGVVMAASCRSRRNIEVTVRVNARPAALDVEALDRTRFRLEASAPH